MKRLAILTFLLVAACGSFGAQAHSISLAYKAGDTYRYGLHLVLKFTVAAAGMSLPLDADLSAKETVAVKSVDSVGTADATVTIADATTKTSMNGTTNTTTTTTPRTIDLKIASDGRIVSVNGTAVGIGALPGLDGQGGLMSAILPDHPVKAGDTWSKSYSEAGAAGTGSIQVTSDNTYLRDETVGGVTASVIESKIKHNLDLTIDASSIAGQSAMPTMTPGETGGVQNIVIKGTATTDVTSWIDTSAHRIVQTRSSGTVDATVTATMAASSTTPGLSGPITFKGTQTLDLTPA